MLRTFITLHKQNHKYDAYFTVYILIYRLSKGTFPTFVNFNALSVGIFLISCLKIYPNFFFKNSNFIMQCHNS